METDRNHLTLRGGPVGVRRRDRSDPYCLFDAVPQVQFRFEAELAAVDRLLQDWRLPRRVPRGADQAAFAF